MEQYKADFIEFMARSGVLRFEEFITKSGRISPYFVNTGNYETGAQLSKLGKYYAERLNTAAIPDEYDVLFGPAYKGIPLAVATVMAISKIYGVNIRYCANRKEVKDHGDTGILLGSKLRDGDRVVIIEDVTTSGASMAETVPILRAQADVEILGLMVSLNRMEVGLEGKVSALDEIKEKYGFPAGAIVTMQDVMDYLGTPKEGETEAFLNDDMKEALRKYYEEYGVH